MKKIFKKNQLMITVLALMIAVTGYLKYTGSTLDEETYKAETENTNVAEDMDAMLDISDEDTYMAGSGDIESLDSEVVVVSEQYLDEDMAELLGENLSGYMENPASVVSETGEALISEESSTLTVQNPNAVTDSETAKAGDNSVVDDIPGEAVFTSAAGISVISGAKLEKEQIRSRNKEALMEIINNVNIAEEQKQGAIDNMVAMTNTAEKEVSAQILLEAKGFPDVVVSIDQSSCDVMVAVVELTSQECAQIIDIVSRKTGMNAENIIITPVGNE